MNKIMGVEMHEVESSHIESVGYDGINRQMLVKFKDREKKDGTITRGSVTKFNNIPGRHFAKMKDAHLDEKALSAGKYFHKEVKGQYEYTTYKDVKKVEDRIDGN